LLALVRGPDMGEGEGEASSSPDSSQHLCEV